MLFKSLYGKCQVKSLVTCVCMKSPALTTKTNSETARLQNFVCFFWNECYTTIEISKKRRRICAIQLKTKSIL